MRADDGNLTRAVSLGTLSRSCQLTWDTQTWIYSDRVTASPRESLLIALRTGTQRARELRRSIEQRCPRLRRIALHRAAYLLPKVKFPEGLVVSGTANVHSQV